MWNHGKVVFKISVCLFAGLLASGCVTNKNTVTARSATEQLVLSTAADHALSNIGLEMFSGHRVFLDTSYFDSYDPKYVIGTIRDALSRSGALLQDSPTNAEMIMEARSGALAINESETMFGIPAVTLPLPLSGPVQTPEVAFYKAEKEHGIAKFALLVRDKQSAAHLYSSGSLDGKSYDKSYRVIFVGWHRTDVAEIEDTPKKAKKFQTWLPQNDMTNLPVTNGPAK